jgi:hypothetical protein
LPKASLQLHFFYLNGKQMPINRLIVVKNTNNGGNHFLNTYTLIWIEPMQIPTKTIKSTQNKETAA